MKRKILDYISKSDYENLPQSYKDKRQQLTNIGKSIDKLTKRKNKINNELQSIYTETKTLKRQYTELYNDLQFFNKQYLPKCYVVINYKGKNKTEFLNLVIKHTKTTSIYLGEKNKVIKTLKPYSKNLNNKNFKTVINDLLSTQIRKLIDFNQPNYIVENTILFKDILKVLDDNDETKNIFNMFN